MLSASTLCSITQKLVHEFTKRYRLPRLIVIWSETESETLVGWQNVGVVTEATAADSQSRSLQ